MISKRKEFILVGVFVVIVLIMTVLNSSFLSLSNLKSMGKQLPELMIISLGMMAVILTGGIDLSLASIVALTGIVGAYILSSGNTKELTAAGAVELILLAIAAMLATGLICGVINGLLIAYIGMHPILATLGTQMLFNGISMVLTQGGSVSGFPSEFQWIGQGQLLIPFPLIVMIVTIAVAALLLNKSAWGRSVYMFGSNPVATKYSGINIRSVNFKVYIFSAMMATIAGVIMASRYNSGKVGLGDAYLLEAVAVVVLGGTAIEGGSGKVSGTIIAACIIQVINTGFNVVGINANASTVMTGAILVFILLANSLLAKHHIKKGIQKTILLTPQKSHKEMHN